MVKVAFIGAGSYGFTVKLLADILSFDELLDSELTFMDVDPKRMERVKTIVDAYLKKEGYPQKPLYTRSRKKALEGAKTGIRNIPIIMYMAMLAAPRLLPRTAPAQSTANVCPVMGTGVPGNFIAIWAKMAVRRANDTTRAVSTARPPRGIIESIKVGFFIVGFACISFSATKSRGYSKYREYNRRQQAGQ